MRAQLEDRRSLFIFVGSWCQLESKHPVKQCYSRQLPDLNGGASRSISLAQIAQSEIGVI